MKMIHCITLTLLTIILCGCTAHKQALFEEAKGLHIVISQPASPAANLAAHELQYALHKVSGQTVNITDKKLSGFNIFIGNSRFTEERGFKMIDYKHNEYSVKIDKNEIILFGKDAVTSSGKIVDFGKLTGGHKQLLQLPGMYEAQGSLRATYDFIEKYLGVRYYGPKEYMCHFPAKSNVLVGLTHLKRQPQIEYTNGLCDDRNGTLSWPIQKILYDHASSDEVLLFARRLRTGGKAWYVNHTFHHMKYKERFGKEISKRYPQLYEGYQKEFWPPEGSRSTQLCYSSEALAKQVAQDAADYFDNKLQNKGYGMPVANMDVFPVVPNDAGNYCTCEKCQAMLEPFKNDKISGTFGNGQASYLVFNFVNKVARHLKKTHPEKFIGALAYEGYMWQPKGLKIEDNVRIAPALVSTCSNWDKTQKDNDLKAYHFWVDSATKRHKKPLYLWNYYHHPEEIGAIRKHKVFPQFTPHSIGQWSKRYKRDNVKGIFLCGWGEGLDFYLMMKTFDNPDIDVDKLLNTYFTNSFGVKAGIYMLQFYSLMEAIVDNPENYQGSLSQRTYWQLQGHEANLKKLEEILNMADSQCSGELSRKRLQPWKNLMTYMWEGHKAWNHTKIEQLTKAAHTSIEPNYISPVSVYTSGGQKSPYSLIKGQNIIEEKPGLFGSKGAKLSITNDKDAHWAHWGPDGVFVEFDLGKVHSLAEMRIWNYQQNRGYKLNRRGMRMVKIETSSDDQLSSWQLLVETIIPKANDLKASLVDKIIDCKGIKARRIRITVVGEPGIGNWSAKEPMVGLGQVRFYSTAKTKL